MGYFVSHQFMMLVCRFLLYFILLSNIAFANSNNENEGIAIALPQQLLNEKLLQAIDREVVELSVIEKLINKGANPHNTALLEKALERNHATVLQQLLNNAEESLKTADYNTLLATAVEKGHWESIAVLLNDNDQPINRSLLFKVANSAHLATFNRLKRRKIINDILDENTNNRCRLATVVKGNNHEILRWFLTGGIPLNEPCDGLLSIAVENNSLAVVKTLVEAGVAINGIANEISPLEHAIKNGNLDLVRFLLKKGALLRRDQHARPLEKAAFYGHTQLLRYLLGYEKQQRSQGVNALARAAIQGGHLATVQFLQQQGADLKHKIVRPALMAYLVQQENPSEPIATTTALHLAAEQGHLDIVRYLLEDIKLDVNAKEISGLRMTTKATLTALHYAVERGDYPLVHFLLQQGADLEAVDQQKGTALLLAVQHNALDLVRLFVKKGVRYQRAALRQLPLQAAVINQHLPMVTFLLRSDPERHWQTIINMKNRDGETALHYASRLGNLSLVQRLINAGARADIPNARGETALHAVLQQPHHDVFRLLLRHQHQVNALNKQQQTPLATIITNQDGFYAAELLAKQANIHLRNQQQQTLLHQLVDEASRYSYQASIPATISNDILLRLMTGKTIEARIEWLLRHKIALDAQDQAGDTALHYLAIKPTTVLLKRILQQKPDLNRRNQAGNSPLYLAIRAGETENALLLLQAGADPNQVGANDKTPLYLAVEHDNLKVVDQLLQQGANINQRNKAGQNSLFALVDAGTSTTIVERLIVAGIDLKSRDRHGNTIIQALSRSMSKDDALPRLQRMLEKGGESNVRNADLLTPLHHAILSHAPQTAQLLLASGANSNAQDKDGATPLHYAVRLRAFKQIEQLIAHKASLNHYNRFGKTPLHIAVDEGDQALVKLLLAAGATVHSVDKDLRTPLISAVAQNDTAIALLLIQHHANPNAMSKGGWRPLHLAVQQANTILVKALLKKGADQQLRLWRGDTVATLVRQHNIHKQHELSHWLATTQPMTLPNAFLQAASQNNKARLKILLQQGTDINVADRYGQTVLHKAIEAMDSGLVAWLLAQGANPNQADIYQQTPLEKALLPDAQLAESSEKMLTALLTNHADINHSNRHSETLLLTAVRNKTRLQKVQLLLAHGAKVNARDYFYNTPLLEASRQGKIAVVKTLIAAKAMLNQQNGQGDNSLHLALSTPVEQGIAPLLTPPQNPQQLTKEETQQFIQQAEQHYRQIAHYLLDQGINSQAVNHAQQSPLALAVDSKRLTLIKKILTKQTNQTQTQAQTDTHAHSLPALALRALQQQQFGIAKVLLSYDATLSFDNAMGLKLLKMACAKTQQADHAAASLVALLFDKGVKQRIVRGLVRDADKFALLQSVIQNDALKTLRVLQTAGLTIQQQSATGQHVLLLAARYNAPKIASFLLKAGVPINQADASGMTALMAAAKAGAVDVMALLLAQQADPNQQDRAHDTALHYALRFKHKNQTLALKMAQQLIAQGANPALVPQALHIAISQKNDALISYLIHELHYKVNTLVAGDTALHSALRHFNTFADKGAYNQAEVQRIRFLIRNGADVNRANNNKRYPIQQALAHPLALNLLLQHNATITPRTETGDTLLHTLLSHHDDEALTRSLALLLTTKTVDQLITSQNKQGNTPLHALLFQTPYSEQNKKNQQDKLTLLLQHPSMRNPDRLNAKNHQQQTPLSLALLNNFGTDKQAIILALLAMHPVVEDSDVLTACYEPVLLAALLQQGGNVNSRDSEGRGCLQTVFRVFDIDNSLATLKVLVKHGVDINQQDKQGKTALHHLIAVMSEQESAERQHAKQQVLAFLWRQKPDITRRTYSKQQTALFFAGNAALVKNLLQQGFAVDAYDQAGNTYLQTTNNIAIANVLIDNGSAIEHKNKQGETVLFLAVKNNNEQLVDYLLAQGANPNIIDVNDNNVLHMIRSDRLAERLLAKGAKVNQANQAGNTPLHLVRSLALAKRFIAYGAALDLQNNVGQTALICLAGKKESGEIALYLVEQGADVSLKDQWHETALFKAAYINNRELAKQLLLKGSQSDQRNTLGDNPVHIALSKKHWQVAELLISQQAVASLDQLNWEQKTPLAFAFEARQFGIATLLSNRGASQPKWPFTLTAQAGNPFWLQRALHTQLTTVAAQLLIPSATVSEKEIQRRVRLREYGTNQTNLHRAAALGATHLIEPLLRYGARVNTVNNANETALHEAVSQSHIDTVKILLAHNARLTMIDANDNTVLHRAVSGETKDKTNEMLAFLLALKVPQRAINAKNKYGETALHLACHQHDVASVKLLLDNQATVNVRNHRQRTPLLLAAETADEAIMTLLLNHGADVTMQDEAGRTPLLVLLHQHIYLNRENGEPRNHAKIVRLVDLLLRHHADLQAVGKDGRRAIHLAMPVREMAHAILDRITPAALHAVDQEGDTPLFYAVRALYPESDPAEIPRRLLKMDKTLVKHKNKWGETALQKAIRSQNIAAIRLLIQSGVDVNAANKGGYTPLLNIVRNEVVQLKQQPLQDFVRLLLTKGADINKADERQNTPLHIALSTEQDALAHFLIANHAALNRQNNHGDTPLHLLAQRHTMHKEQQASTLKLVDTLLAKKARTDYRNHNSSTPLHLAVKQNNLLLIQRLLASGADVNAANTSGETPLHLAVLHGSVSSIKSLLAYHANLAAKDNQGNYALHLAMRNKNKAIVKLLLQVDTK